MYDNSFFGIPASGGVATGTLAASSGFTWASAGWLAMAAFVLVMAGVALFTIIPRKRAAVAKVNPAPVR